MPRSTETLRAYAENRKNEIVLHISHVSIAVVLRVAGAQPLGEVLLRQELSYFGRIARMPNGAAIRQVVFDPGTLQL